MQRKLVFRCDFLVREIAAGELFYWWRVKVVASKVVASKSGGESIRTVSHQARN